MRGCGWFFKHFMKGSPECISHSLLCRSHPAQMQIPPIKVSKWTIPQQSSTEGKQACLAVACDTSTVRYDLGVCHWITEYKLNIL